MRIDAGTSESCILGPSAQCEGLYSHILVQQSTHRCELQMSGESFTLLLRV